jgi:hypothetical protein
VYADTDMRVRELCRKVAVEQNAEQLLALVCEVNRLLAEKIANAQSQKHRAS